MSLRDCVKPVVSISLLNVVDAADTRHAAWNERRQIKRNPVDVNSNYRFSLSPDCRAWLNTDKLITSPMKTVLPSRCNLFTTTCRLRDGTMEAVQLYSVRFVLSTRYGRHNTIGYWHVSGFDDATIKM